MPTQISRIRNFVNDKNNTIPITASYMDAELDQLVTECNKAVTIKSSAPSSPVEGQTWYDSTNKKLMLYRNSAFDRLDVPAGVVVPYGAATAPTGWLLGIGGQDELLDDHRTGLNMNTVQRSNVARLLVSSMVFVWLFTSHWSPVTGHCFAAVSHLIRYQGRLVDSAGSPLTTPQTLTFRLYDDPTPGQGNKAWGETHSSVPVTNGQFSVLLGNGTLEAGSPPLSDVDWSVPLWLAVQVGTDPEMTPRQAIASVPLALRAELAEQLEGPITTVGTNVGIGTANPTTTLEVVGAVKIADGTEGVGKVLTSDASGVAYWESLPPGMPAGGIILWDGAACPVGYTRLTDYDGKFLVGALSAGSTGGSDAVSLTVNEIPAHQHTGPSHTHTTPNHIHTLQGQGTSNSKPYGHIETLFPNGTLNDGAKTIMTGSFPSGTPEGGGTTSADGTGPTGSTGDGQPFDNRPAFKTILLCKKD